MFHTCEVCGEEMDVPFPYGENIVCPHCGQEYETEMDESCSEDGDESLTWWITGKVEKVSSEDEE